MQAWSCCSLPSSPRIAKFIWDHPTLRLLETKCTTMRDLLQLHSQLIKSGLANDAIAASRLLAFCATSPRGDLSHAALLFSRTHRPTSFMFNTLIRALSNSSNPEEALLLFVSMLHSSTQPHRLTFPSVFVACGHLGELGDHLHCMVLKLGLASDSYIRNSLIYMYAACGDITAASQVFDEILGPFDVVSWNSMIHGFGRAGLVDDARRLFDEMPQRTQITWVTMISGYVRNGRNREALDLFGRMQESRVKPNAPVLVSLLNACACLGALEQGGWAHSYIKRNKIEINPIVLTAIIDMYCKCGSIDRAVRVFENAKSIKGLSSWNSLIFGLAMHGRGDEALRYFSRLRSSGLRPDNVTFLSILTACNHSGMVNEAWYYFRIMASEEHNIEPKMEHYGCMVDVLGRAGLIDEAVELVHQMPMEPDNRIWRSLLAACRVHENIEIGMWVASRLADWDPKDTGGSVLLSNLFGSSGEFKEAVKLRLGMKEEGVWKEPGCSMIVVDGVAHEFIASGVKHPKAREIYELLDGLVLALRTICLYTDAENSVDQEITQDVP